MRKRTLATLKRRHLQWLGAKLIVQFERERHLVLKYIKRMEFSAETALRVGSRETRGPMDQVTRDILRGREESELIYQATLAILSLAPHLPHWAIP